MNENQNNFLITRENLQNIVKLIPTSIYIWKRVENDFILIDYNKAAEDITHGDIENFLGIKATVLHKNDPEILQDLNYCFDNRKKISKEIESVFKTTGLEKILYITYDFVPPNLVLVYTEDITERKRAELRLTESEERFRIIIDKAVPAFAINDLEGNILMVNDLAVKMLGYSKEELL